MQVHQDLGAVLLQLGDLPAARQELRVAAAIVEARFPSDSLAQSKLASSLALAQNKWLASHPR